MTDEHISQAVFLLQIAQKLDYFGLYGAVKCRSRLIQKDEFRAQDNGACNSDTLTLAAGKFVRITVERIKRQGYFLHDFQNALDTFFFGHLRMVNRQTFANNFANGQTRRKRTERILEHNLPLRFQTACFFGGIVFQVFAFKGDIAGIRQHLHDGFTQRGFAGTGLADDAQCFAFFNFEADAFDGVKSFERFAEKVLLQYERNIDIIGID